MSVTGAPAQAAKFTTVKTSHERWYLPYDLNVMGEAAGRMGRHWKQRTQSVQGHRVGNELGVFKERRGGLSDGEGGIYSVSQKIKGFVAMVCMMAFTQATVGKPSERGHALPRVMALL